MNDTINTYFRIDKYFKCVENSYNIWVMSRRHKRWSKLSIRLISRSSCRAFICAPVNNGWKILWKKKLYWIQEFLADKYHNPEAERSIDGISQLGNFGPDQGHTLCDKQPHLGHNHVPDPCQPADGGNLSADGYEQDTGIPDQTYNQDKQYTVKARKRQEK